MTLKCYIVNNQTLAETVNGTLSYLVTDLLSNVVMAIGVSGTAVAVNPYGKVNDSWGSMPTDKNYTGQQRDSQNGLISYKFRWYDPLTGEFTRADTKQDNAIGMDPYAYVGDNPETKNDPTGHWGWGAIALIVAVVVVVAVVAIVAAPVLIAAAAATAEVAADGAAVGAVAEGAADVAAEAGADAAVEAGTDAAVDAGGDAVGDATEESSEAFAKSAAREGASELSAQTYGPASDNAQDALNNIVSDVQNSGGKVNFNDDIPPGQGSYQPSLRSGEPGSLNVNPDTDISTLSHEYQHFLDDRSLGYPGASYYMQNPEVKIAMERNAYNVEINMAQQGGYDELSDQLQQASDEQVSEIVEKYGLDLFEDLL